MSTAVATPKKKISHASLEAGDRLLKAVKERMLKQRGRVDFDELRRQGYSETTLAKLEEI